MTATSRKEKANGRVKSQAIQNQEKRIARKHRELGELRASVEKVTANRPPLQWFNRKEPTTNATGNRRGRLPGVSHDGKRDIWSIAGYLPYNSITYQDYRQIYDRTLGGRIVDKYVQSTWQKPPAISEDEGVDTPFTEDTETMAKKFDLWETFSTADTQASIGEFGIILIGLNDQPTDDEGQSIGSGNLSKAVKPGSLKGLDDLLYLRPYGQDSIAQIDLNGDPSSPRFGQPEIYTIQFENVDASGGTAISFGETPGLTVHWTRVIHLAEDTLDNSVIGIPKMRRSLNILMEIQKTLAGSAEAYWRIADRGMAVTVDSDATLLKGDLDDIEDQIDEYINGMRRYLTLQDAKVQELGGKDVNPEGMFSVEEKILAATSGIPNRIYFGSERGNLASGQDAKEWAGTISTRQRTYAEPIVRDLLDRLIVYGVLSSPKGGVGDYNLGQPNETGIFTWPSILENNPKEEAEIVNVYASSLSSAQTAQVNGVVMSDDEVRGFGNLPQTGETQDDMLQREDDMIEDSAIDG
jgi:hypothetical protein